MRKFLNDGRICDSIIVGHSLQGEQETTKVRLEIQELRSVQPMHKILDKLDVKYAMSKKSPFPDPIDRSQYDPPFQ
jgi:hypothetical protein